MNKSILHLNNRDNTDCRVICIPHAGGYATQYSQWIDYLPSHIDCVVYEKPGSGQRFGEKSCSDWDDIVNDALGELDAFFDIPYIIFGHSLGGAIAFEICHVLRKQNIAQSPLHLFIGDTNSPFVIPSINRASLSNSQLKEILIKEYDLGNDVCNNNEIMDLFLPILRNDFFLADSYYSHRNQSIKIDCNLSVIRPAETRYPLYNHSSWQALTSKQFDIIAI